VSKKKSFLIHIDSLDILDELTNEQCGELFKAIKAHHANQKIALSQLVNIAFSPFKNQFIRDDEKYLKTCEARSLAGSMGGKQKVANASKCKQNVAKLADSVSDNKKDNDNNNNKIKRKAFSKPTREDIRNLSNCEKLNTVGFFDYYESNGWKVGKNPMKDWKAAARGWSKRQGNYFNKQDEPNFEDDSTDWAVNLADKVF